MKRVVVLGSVNVDLVVSADRMPFAGETITGRDFHLFPGGKGANQAVTAAKLYAGEVAFAGMMGADAFAPMLRQSLAGAGVNVEHMAVHAGSSGAALITVDGAGQNSIVVVPGANGYVDRDFVRDRRALLEGAGILLLQLETPMGAVEEAACIASACGVVVILDPAPVRSLDPSLLQSITWLTPNYTEACQLTGRPVTKSVAEDAPMQIDDLLGDLLRLGAQNVLLKLGSDGVAIATRSGERHRIPALSIEAIDTTAAGDALNGGFAVGLAEGMSPFDAAVFATAVAGISVTRRGAQPAMPSRQEVNAYLAGRPRS